MKDWEWTYREWEYQTRLDRCMDLNVPERYKSNGQQTDAGQ